MSLLFNFGAREAENLKGKSVACFVGHPVYKVLYRIFLLGCVMSGLLSEKGE